MDVLVTGGAGYIGSVVHRYIRDEGHHVEVVDDLSTGHANAVSPGVRLHQLPLELTHKVLRGRHFDAVVHLAAKASVEDSVRRPGDYWRTNVVGTLALLDAMVASGTSRIVFSSTAAVYGAPTEFPITEEAPVRPLTPYGTSKLAAEHAIAGYALAHGIDAISFRYFNVAGSYQNAVERHPNEPHLLPRAVRAAVEGTPFELYGSDFPTSDGTCVRDFLHVRDVARAHGLALAGQIHSGHRVFNLASGRGWTVREVVDEVTSVLGRRVDIVESSRRLGDPPILVASANRAIAELGWVAADSILGTMIAETYSALYP